ncbi:hypothetical protein DES53_11947 [Roseimicrobium gellanilyticum]|uniref:Uncharacterized protein n=1 Tax=Roseimicrobium gellanilyticum TaxID=748857 RepID=A0A366H1W2_9BACT|nr:hypothetical protein [Roseimicrobium gellanilyticum]RBP35881.1 hypothetical protein DES53_11947 [Roseimicrobium gellanilyticum]
MLKIAVLAGIALVAPSLGAQGPAASSAGGAGATPVPPPAKKEKFTDSNPALLYWQAFALLPELKQPQLKIITEVLEGRLSASDPSVGTLLGSTRRALERFARAARGTQPCVWGTTLDEGPFAPMPHLTKLQQMCRLALVQVEAHYASGELEKAWTWTKHVHAAARHLAAEPLLITTITQQGVEQQAIRTTARHALSLDTDHGQAIIGDMKAMPPLHTVREALTGEHAMADWMRHMVLGIQNSPENEQAMLDVAQSLLNAQSQDADSSKSAAAKQALASMEEWKKNAEQGRELQARAEAASTKPWKDYQADLKEMHASLVDAGQVLKNTLPAFEGAMRKQFETQTLHIMLFAVLQPPDEGHLNGEMKGAVDSFEGKALMLNRDAVPWVISTQGSMNGRPLKLEIGR